MDFSVRPVDVSRIGAPVLTLGGARAKELAPGALGVFGNC